MLGEVGSEERCLPGQGTGAMSGSRGQAVGESWVILFCVVCRQAVQELPGAEDPGPQGDAGGDYLLYSTCSLLHMALGHLWSPSF